LAGPQLDTTTKLNVTHIFPRLKAALSPSDGERDRVRGRS